MTEDILFDNIYVGHSPEDAKKLAKETFHVKKPIESAEAEAAKPEDKEDKVVSFKEEPLEWLREQAFSFYELALIDPIAAFKAKPETGAAIVAVLLTFFGSLGALFGLIGGSQKPVVKVCSLPTNAIAVKLISAARSSLPRRSTHLQRTRKRPSQPMLPLRFLLFPLPPNPQIRTFASASRLFETPAVRFVWASGVDRDAVLCTTFYGHKIATLLLLP